MNYSGMIKYLPAVLLFCSCTESGLLLRERERFAVHFSASGIGMEVTTRASSPLSDNTTLRILAFRRVGQSPDLQADEYKTLIENSKSWLEKLGFASKIEIEKDETRTIQSTKNYSKKQHRF